MNAKQNTMGESHTQVITEIHSSLEKGNFDRFLEIMQKIGPGPKLDDISQSFLLTYHYNFRTRYFEKADFNYCLKFSDILNKRTPA